MIAVADDAPQKWARAMGRASRNLLAHFHRPHAGIPVPALNERFRNDVSFHENAAANQVRW